jgi:hypothetical protein
MFGATLVVTMSASDPGDSPLRNHESISGKAISLGARTAARSTLNSQGRLSYTAGYNNCVY